MKVLPALLAFAVLFAIHPAPLHAGTLELGYSTYLGGSSPDFGWGIALGTAGEAYIVGYYTNSANFPTSDAYQASLSGGYDSFVSKVSSSGSSLIYSTYLGGTGNDYAEGITPGTGGQAYVIGYTQSTNFPTLGAYQATYGGGTYDAFVSSLSSSGSSLIYSTYLGGSSADIGHSIMLGTAGEAYVSGDTVSTNFPTLNAYQATYGAGASDIFVGILSSSGSSLSYSTYLGGSGEDIGYGIALGAGGEAFVTGYTASANFPTWNAYQAAYGGGSYDDYVSSLSSSGSSLIYSTYLGGSGSDYGRKITLGTGGVAYVTGYTSSSDFPTSNPYQASNGGSDDAFVSSLSSSGSSLIYSTYFGGNGGDNGYGIALGSGGEAYVAGNTLSTNFPTLHAYQATFGGGSNDDFIGRLSSSGSSLIYSTYLGGSSSDSAYGITLGSGGEAYVSGMTSSINFPTMNPYQATYGGGTQDAFVSKLVYAPTPPTPTPIPTATPSPLPSLTPSVTPTPSPEPSATPSPEPSLTPSATPTPTPEPSATPSPEPSASPSIAPSATPTPPGLKTPSPTPSPSVTPSATPTPTPEPSVSPSPSPSATPSAPPSATPTPTVSPTPFGYKTPSPTSTPPPQAGTLQLVYSTYLGGSLDDEGYGIALGTGGEAYVTGCTSSSNFPTNNPYQQLDPSAFSDAFVSCLSSSGSALIYSTYLGGLGGQNGCGIAVGANAEACVTGWTTSDDFPTVNSFQASRGGSYDVFVTQLSSSGSSIIRSSYLGGGDLECGYGISVGSAGEAYIVGDTMSSDFPTLNSYQASYGGGTYDAFVSSFSSSGSELIYSTYLGGTHNDRGNGIALGSGGLTYATGFTKSANFPTLNAYQGSSNGNEEAFLVKFLSSGSTLCYSTYLGGDSYDTGWGIAVDSEGSLYAVGFTDSQSSGITPFPIVNAYQTTYGGEGDVFVSRLSSTGSFLIFSTYLGGGHIDQGLGISLGIGGEAYVAGSTCSIDFPTWNPYQESGGGENYDTFISRLSSSGSRLIFSTYLGGGNQDELDGIALGPIGEAYVTGFSQSDDFPTINPYQASYVGWRDVFVSKLIFVTPAPTTPTPISPTPSQSLTPSPVSSATPSPKPSATPSPSAPPTSSPSPSPSPTIYRCFDVSGQVTDKITGQPIDGIQVQAFVTGDYSSSVGTGDANGLFTVRPCTHYTDGIVRAEARKRGYLPAFATAPYASWSEVTGISIELIPSLFPQGVISSDYDGNGATDTAVFQLPERIWAVRNVTRIYFGGETDELVPADYDGDGTTNVCILRPANGSWAIHNLTRYYFGSIGAIPIPGDYNGDGTGELAVVRAWDSLWSVRGFTRFYLGSTYDQPVPRDFSGDGVPDPGMYRRSGGMWAIRNITRVYFGSSDDLAPGDFTGSGTWEPGIFRESTSLWSIRNVTRLYLGSSGDWAVPADYDHDGADEAGVFRNSSGLWSVFNTTRMYFGGPDDIPVTR